MFTWPSYIARTQTHQDEDKGELRRPDLMHSAHHIEILLKKLETEMCALVVAQQCPQWEARIIRRRGVKGLTNHGSASNATESRDLSRWPVGPSEHSPAIGYAGNKATRGEMGGLRMRIINLTYGNRA